MKLNHDCVRELLLLLEKKLEFSNDVDLLDISIGNFSEEEITYTAMKLNEAQYINAKFIKDVSGQVYGEIYSITWEGHKFLDAIRDNQVWSKTKNALKKIGSCALDVVGRIASAVVVSQIN